MTIQECSQAMGGDYEQAVKRLSSEAMVRRFIGRFLEDGSYQQLCAAMKEKKRRRIGKWRTAPRRHWKASVEICHF